VGLISQAPVYKRLSPAPGRPRAARRFSSKQALLE
jgi:hypothetical protein